MIAHLSNSLPTIQSGNARLNRDCTVPAAGKCPEEIAVWCEKALQQPREDRRFEMTATPAEISKMVGLRNWLHDTAMADLAEKLAKFSVYVIGCMKLKSDRVSAL